MDEGRELKLCPCGGQPMLRGSRDGDVEWYECCRCKRCGPLKLSAREAIAGWNHALSAPPATAPINCTCHPDDRPQGACRQRFAASECQATPPAAPPVDAVRSSVKTEVVDNGVWSLRFTFGRGDEAHKRMLAASAAFRAALNTENDNGALDARDRAGAGVCRADAVADGHGQLGSVTPTAPEATAQAGASDMREARRLIERLASADIDVSGTAAIGISSADIIAANDWIDSLPLTPAVGETGK